jgi:hypothetical protein
MLVKDIGQLNVYINGWHACTIPQQEITVDTQGIATVYLGDPWHKPAAASVSNAYYAIQSAVYTAPVEFLSTRWRGHGGADCDSCPAGTYASQGTVTCEDCRPGFSDADESADTPCSPCPAGRYAVESGRSGLCTACSAGRFAPYTSGSSEDVCQACEPGNFAPQASPSCTACSAGAADLDSDPSTECSPCQVGSTSGCRATTCEECAVGQYDKDSDPSTPCERCVAGEQWDAGASTSAVVDNQHVPSDPELSRWPVGVLTGCSLQQRSTASCTWPPQGSVYAYPSACSACPAGKIDGDTLSTTPCNDCSVGTYAPGGETVCVACEPVI